jgi:hypothetical protein
MHRMPGGPKSALGSAIACGILLGVFEGVGVLLSRVFSEGTRPQLPQRTSRRPTLFRYLTVFACMTLFFISLLYPLLALNPPLVSRPQCQILFNHNPQDTSSIPSPQSIL